MAQIDIHRPHGMSEDAARRRAEDLARRLEQRRGVRWRWEGDELRLDAPSGPANSGFGAPSRRFDSVTYSFSRMPSTSSVACL